jgi:hypothetical protein
MRKVAADKTSDCCATGVAIAHCRPSEMAAAMGVMDRPYGVVKRSNLALAGGLLLLTPVTAGAQDLFPSLRRDQAGHPLLGELSDVNCHVAGWSKVMPAWACRQDQADYWMVRTRVGQGAFGWWVHDCDEEHKNPLIQQALRPVTWQPCT